MKPHNELNCNTCLKSKECETCVHNVDYILHLQLFFKEAGSHLAFKLDMFKT